MRAIGALEASVLCLTDCLTCVSALQQQRQHFSGVLSCQTQSTARSSVLRVRHASHSRLDAEMRMHSLVVRRAGSGALLLLRRAGQRTDGTFAGLNEQEARTS